MNNPPSTEQIFEKLIAFPTVSRDPNIELIQWVDTLLVSYGVRTTIIKNDQGTKANLYASVGPEDRAGAMLSGHTDVVPVDGQEWTKPPFELTKSDGRYYGRGTADMKGFCAAAIRTMCLASATDLAEPLHLALSYDEEIGCIGVRSLVDMLKDAPIRPAMCIVGEPTGLAVASGHKGKIALRATCRGQEGHSALAPLAYNAIHLATDFVGLIRDMQDEIAAGVVQDTDYDVPYTTLHVGKIAGGVALNIVPNLCTVDWEIRNLAQDNQAGIIAEVARRANDLVEKAGNRHAAIEMSELFSYPGLNTPREAAVIEFVRSLTGSNATIKVAFGTEGGLFDADLNIPTVVCGPGSMMQGHKPDEFVSDEQMLRCDAMMAALVTRLKVGF